MKTKNRHLQKLIERAPALADCVRDAEKAFIALRDIFHNNGKLLLCGNGGSASDAEHWAGELLKGFCHGRALDERQAAGLPGELAASLQGAFPVIPLTGFPAFSTAFANDIKPEHTFAQLVWALGCGGDAFVGISTSGNARNVCAAAQTARACGMLTLALTGRSGGRLAGLCDIAIRVPATETYLVREYHLPMYHCLCLMLEEEFFPHQAERHSSAAGRNGRSRV